MLKISPAPSILFEARPTADLGQLCCMFLHRLMVALEGINRIDEQVLIEHKFPMLL